METSGNQQNRKKTDTLSPTVRDIIKRIAYEHGMTYQEAKIHYIRALLEEL